LEREGTCPIGASLGRPPLDEQVTPFDVAVLTKASSEVVLSRAGHRQKQQDADPGQWSGRPLPPQRTARREHRPARSAERGGGPCRDGGAGGESGQVHRATEATKAIGSPQ